MVYDANGLAIFDEHSLIHFVVSMLINYSCTINIVHASRHSSDDFIKLSRYIPHSSLPCFVAFQLRGSFFSGSAGWWAWPAEERTKLFLLADQVRRIDYGFQVDGCLAVFPGRENLTFPCCVDRMRTMESFIMIWPSMSVVSMSIPLHSQGFLCSVGSWNWVSLVLACYPVWLQFPAAAWLRSLVKVLPSRAEALQW